MEVKGQGKKSGTTHSHGDSPFEIYHKHTTYYKHSYMKVVCICIMMWNGCEPLIQINKEITLKMSAESVFFLGIYVEWLITTYIAYITRIIPYPYFSLICISFHRNRKETLRQIKYDSIVIKIYVLLWITEAKKINTFCFKFYFTVCRITIFIINTNTYSRVWFIFAY